MKLNIYRGGPGTYITVDIDEQTKLYQRLLGEDYIRLKCMYNTVQDIQIGDYVTDEGEDFFVNSMPNVRKVSNREFHYDVLFEARK